MRVEHLRTPTPDEIRTMTTLRDGEVRLGQRVGIVGPEGQTPAGTQVVLVGIPEDIGVRANLGRAGARRMWRAFLPRFLNMQSNTFLDGATVAIAGCIDVRDLNKAAKGIDATVGGPRARAEALVTLREMVTSEQVEALLTGRIDVGLVRPPMERAEFVTARVLTEPLVAALPTGDPRLAKASLTLADFDAAPLIMYSAEGAGYFYNMLTTLFSRTSFLFLCNL